MEKENWMLDIVQCPRSFTLLNDDNDLRVTVHSLNAEMSCTQIYSNHNF